MTMQTFYIGLTSVSAAAEEWFSKDLEMALGTKTFDTVEGTFEVREGTKPVKQVLKVTVEAVSVDN